ncbi:SAM-dependent methyltransferase [Nannocystaceae bacterium ST9]
MTIVLHPVAWIRAPRSQAIDDYWRDLASVIELDPSMPDDAIAGLAEFSHLEIIAQLDRVPEQSIESGARHPRNRADWPTVGIFAQRAKARPNRLGLSRCRLVRVEGRALHVLDLDLIDGTPVLDIKPWMDEFAPIGPVRQPAWSRELMQDYFRSSDEDPR